MNSPDTARTPAAPAPGVRVTNDDPALDPPLEALGVLVEGLREAFEGAPLGRPTFLSDHTAASGLLGTVAGCDVTVATTPGRPGGPSIAAHVQHLAFSLGVARARILGEAPAADWEGSWRVGPLDEAAWVRLRERLAGEYHLLLALLLATLAALDRDGRGAMDAPGSAPRGGRGEALTVLRTAAWTLGHAAYHLGAMRTTMRALASASVRA